MAKKKAQFKKKIIFIISLLFVLFIFLLGVEVGQRFSGLSLKGSRKFVKNQLDLNSEQENIEEAGVDIESDEMDESQMSFFNGLKKERDEESSVSKNHSKFRSPLTEIIQNTKENKEEDSQPANLNIQKNTLSNRYALQVGSYKNRSQAEELESELKQKGYPTYILKTYIPERGIYYRVRIGDFDNLDEAKQVATALQNKEGKNFIITAGSR